MEDNGKNKRVQSLEVGFSILRVFAEKKSPLSLSEIAHETKLHKSQIYRYLNSFVHLGVLSRDNEENQNPKWRLGPELISLGSAAFDTFDVAKLTAPHLIEIKNELNETVALSIWRDRGPFFVRYEKTNKIINVEIGTGSYMPIFTATGKIFRAFLPEEITNELYQKEVIFPDKLNPKEYDLDIERIRKTGISTTEASLVSGIAAISSPIFYPDGSLAAALTIVGIKGENDISPNSLSNQRLLEKCKIISRELGYKGPMPVDGVGTF
ncbi:IclR family transcriptional regulator [Bacillus sp. FJAT-29814]|uniref:IclR family transcriptional regulator n=1 Tax=Bacillus sp. FJAT-29814 TaxID=1729688 RepID=UPI000832BAAC|nr:IclR family transcriptional regulator [Bacillus sp. FJAT-29814]